MTFFCFAVRSAVLNGRGEEGEGGEKKRGGGRERGHGGKTRMKEKVEEIN